MIKPLWTTVWQFLIKLTINLSYDLLTQEKQKYIAKKELYTMVITALFT